MARPAIHRSADGDILPAGTLRIEYESGVDGYRDWTPFRPANPRVPVVLGIRGVAAFFAVQDMLRRAEDHVNEGGRHAS